MKGNKISKYFFRKASIRKLDYIYVCGINLIYKHTSFYKRYRFFFCNHLNILRKKTRKATNQKILTLRDSQKNEDYIYTPVTDVMYGHIPIVVFYNS